MTKQSEFLPLISYAVNINVEYLQPPLPLGVTTFAVSVAQEHYARVLPSLFGNNSRPVNCSIVLR